MKIRIAGGVAAAAVLVGAAWFWWQPARATAPLAGPIVLISVDTLRADHLPVYGYSKVATPAIDALAADGVVFDHAWAHAPQTLPSHASIFTGRLPFEHGVRDNLGFEVKPGEPTLAGQLRSRGFATGGFVSAFVMRAATGLGQGFDTYDDSLPASSPEVAIGEVQKDGAETLAAALRWVGARTSPRWFLFLHLYEPHTPYAPPERFRQFRPYDGEIAYDDELIGRLVADLKQRGLYDQALIVFLSDHGEGLGDHGEQEHGLFLYSETIRVPLVVKLPGQRRAGTRVAAPVQHIDLVPTVLGMAGAPVRAGLRGRSLAPLFGGGAIAEAGIYAEAMYPRFHFGWSELYALTDSRYRFIRAPRDELYDISGDPGELANVAPDRAQTRLAMRQAIDRLLAGVSIDAPAAVTDEDRDRLKALGYIGMQPTVDTRPGAETLPDPKDKVRVLEQYRGALDLVRRGRIDEALAGLRAVVADSPRMADVWAEIAGLLTRAGRIDEAIAAYKRLVEVAPHDPSAIVSVAQLLVQAGRPAEAEAQADAAIRVLPASEGRWRAAAHKVLMRIALDRRDTQTARAQARRAAEADPSMPLPDYLEGLIRYEAGQFAEALPFFQKAVELSVGRTFQIPELRYHLGDTLARLERYDEAERELVEEVRVFPNDLRARAGLAMLYRSQGRDEASARAIDGILRQAPRPDGFALAEKLWLMFGEPARAQQVREAATRGRAPAR